MVVICCLFLQQVTFAVEPYVPQRIDPLTEPWRWRAISELDDKGVNCLAEDAEGAMWFGVNRGVLRYDGLTWTAFNADNGFSDEAVQFLCTAADGSIYASTGSDIWHFVDGRWEKSALLVHLHSLNPATGDGVWLGTRFGAMHLIGNQPTLYTTLDFILKNRPQGIPKTTRIHLFSDTLTGRNRCVVDEILEEPDGTVWLAMNGKKIVRFHRPESGGKPEQLRVYLSEREGLRLRGEIQLSRGDQGVVWGGSPAGIYRYRATTDHWERMDLLGRVDFLGRFVALLSSRDGSWKVALTDKIYSINSSFDSACSFPSLEQSPPLLLEAKNGTLWVGKKQGKMFLVNQESSRWESFTDLNFHCNDGSSRSWFLTQDGRAVCRSGDTWLQYAELDGLMDTPVTLVADQDGQLWAAGSHQHTAATAIFDGNRWIRQLHPEMSESIDENTTLALGDGSVLFAARRPRNQAAHGGVVRARKDRGGEVLYDYLTGSTVPDTPEAMAEQADGRLWFSDITLYHTDGVTKHDVKKTPELGNREVVKLAVDAKDQVWAAKKDRGIYRLRGTNWTHYTAEDGVGGNQVADVLCTADHSVWVATVWGISRFNGQHWTPNVFGREVLGFPLLGGSLRASDDGSVWINLAERNWFYREQFSSISAENYIYPFKTVRYRPQFQPPETDWVVTTERVSPPGNAYFEWQGISPWESTRQSDLRFSWRLNGMEWSPFTMESSHLFLALRPGTYQLDVRSRDMDFNIDATPATLEFTVLAPVWKQSWFILMVSLFSSGLAALAYFLLRANQRNQRHQLEIEQIKLRFFTNISHELRTPLTVMLGPLQSIYEKMDNKEIKEGLRMVMRNGQKLRILVDQILDFRKLEAGKMPIDWSRGDLIQYTLSIFESMDAYGALKEVTCDFEVPRASCMVWFDPDKWQKICGNLLSNAVKYTPAGGCVTANLRIQYDAQGVPERAVLLVEDSGVGIPLDAQSHIFEHYYRAERGGQGSGLGLALVKDLLELIDGAISVTSPVSEKRGTRFVVELPLRIQAPEGVKNEQEIISLDMQDLPLEEGGVDESESSALENRPTLLVIDDQEDIRAYIRTELDDLYAVVEAENGQIGLEKAMQIMPDLVISDIMMPVMDGIELCTLLKTNEITGHIPVILLTALASQQHQLQGLETGADDYVSKPFSMQLLSARIHALLESRRIMREHFGQQILTGSNEFPPSSDQAFQQRVLNIINDRLDDDTFNVDQFASALNMSKRTLQNKIKAVMDQTPSELIRSLRLNQAKQWMEQPNQDRTIAEIAAAVGYLDQSHFGKAFKKQFGETPSAVLARTQNEEN